MEKDNEGKNTGILLFGVIVLAFAMRLIGLGSASLTMNEAENAMAALRLFRDGGNSQLLYCLPTALIFRMFGASEFTARLFPAIMGCLLALLPWLLRGKIGVRKALLLSFLFAADPVLLFWSKRADAVIPAVCLFAAAIVFLLKGRHLAFVVCILIGTCGGERAWPALIILCVCAALHLLLSKNDIRPSFLQGIGKKDILIGIAVFCLFCCAFGIFPGGFACFGRGFTTGFQPGPAWLYPGPAAELFALCLYCLVPFLFCFAGSIRKGRFADLLISLAGLAAMLLWQGIVMLPWITFLMWYGAADEILSLLRKLKGPVNFPFCVAACVIPGAYAFFYFRLVELFKQTNGNELIQITINGTMQTLPLTRFQGTVLLMAASVIILGLVVKILMGFTESDSARRGMLVGCVIILSWVWVTDIWNAGGFDRIGDHPAAPHLANTPNVLNGAYMSYNDSALFEFLDEIIAKHGDSSNTQYGLNLIADDAMLDWYLRDHPGIRTTANGNADLTGVELILDRSDRSYAAEGFVNARVNWRGTMDWRRFTVQDWGKWLIFGDGSPVEDVPIKLWVKTGYIYSFED